MLPLPIAVAVFLPTETVYLEAVEAKTISSMYKQTDQKNEIRAGPRAGNLRRSTAPRSWPTPGDGWMILDATARPDVGMNN